MVVWRRLAWLILAAVLAAGLASCGAGDGSPADARRELDAALARSARDAGVPGAASALWSAAGLSGSAARGWPTSARGGR
jgi:hypothetical protein